MPFTYKDGEVEEASSGWYYDIKATFNSQLTAQPQYRRLEEIHTPSGVPAGAYHVANMATGLADDDYRAKHAVPDSGGIPGALPVASDFGLWLEQPSDSEELDRPTNRQRIYNEAQVWFTE